MNVSLSRKQEDQVRALVEAGRYNSASEVVRAGLRLLEEREAKLSDLRARIQEGVESGTAGAVDIDAIKAEAREALAARRTEATRAA